MKPDGCGWFSGVCRLPSPNFDLRPTHTSISLLVIHSISLPPDEFGGPGICALFTNRLDCRAHPYYAQLVGLRVSAHFLVRRNGSIFQFVGCAYRAWHAGVSQWQGRTHCNDYSIGIELEGCDSTPFASPQYLALIRLTRHLKRHYPLSQIAGHADIAPGRKTDPGPLFDWECYLGGLKQTAHRDHRKKQR